MDISNLTSPQTLALRVDFPAESSDDDRECRPLTWIKVTDSNKFKRVSSDLLRLSPVRHAIPVLGVNQANLSKLESERRHFWNMLVATIPQLKISLNNKAKIRILDVGCGEATDAMPLHSYFGQASYGERGKNISYLGIDIASSEISKARKLHQDQSYLKFLAADATKFEKYPKLRGEFDVIVIRHPVPLSGDWEKIFEQSFSHLAPGGIVLITSYFCPEYMAADRTMVKLGAKKLFAGRNPFSAKIKRDSGLGGFGPLVDWRDNYVAIYTHANKLAASSFSLGF